MFDWSTSNGKGPSIQWAAFYSDCEHEVHEVTSGHRLTLTYNLYISRGVGLLAGKKLSLDPTQLPLYQMLEDMLNNEAFMPRGGRLGAYLAHCYAHTHQKFGKELPLSLKGVDMFLYEAASAAGLDLNLVAITNLEAEDYEEIADRELDEEDDEMSQSEMDDERQGRLQAVYWSGLPEMKIDKDFGEEMSRVEVLLEEENQIRDGDIQWITCPKWKELQSAFIAVSLPSTSFRRLLTREHAVWERSRARNVLHECCHVDYDSTVVST